MNLEEIINISCKLLNKKIKVYNRNFKPNIEKFQTQSLKILGWYPQITIKDGIKRILE